jgi:hypothetical protein
VAQRGQGAVAQKALARSCPCGHPPRQRPTRLPGAALWAREERPRRRLSEGKLRWRSGARSPRVADAAAFGSPGGGPGYELLAAQVRAGGRGGGAPEADRSASPRHGCRLTSTCVPRPQRFFADVLGAREVELINTDIQPTWQEYSEALGFRFAVHDITKDKLEETVGCM